MGEIADMMTSGVMCECCGEYLGEGGLGIPRYCSAECAESRGMPFHNEDIDDDDDPSDPLESRGKPNRNTRRQTKRRHNRIKKLNAYLEKVIAVKELVDSQDDDTTPEEQLAICEKLDAVFEEARTLLPHPQHRKKEKSNGKKN